MNKISLLYGITGQDGSFLAEKLLAAGSEVHGVVRRSSSFNTGRIDHIFDKLKLHYGDLTDPLGINKLVAELKPYAIYNLGAQSHVGVSFELPHYTSQVDAIGTLNILEAIKNNSPDTKFYQASSSELFGKVQEIPQTESTKFYPRSPYGIAKLYSYWMTKNYREAFGLQTWNGILYNHESERRGKTFVTRKITQAVANIKSQKQKFLELGNLDAKRDWGYAPEYVDGMIKMIESDSPDDYILATGKTNTVRTFCTLAFAEAGIDLTWSATGINEIATDLMGDVRVKINPKYYRPAEVDLLVGDATKAKIKLNWQPETILENLVRIMVVNDMKEV